MSFIFRNVEKFVILAGVIRETDMQTRSRSTQSSDVRKMNEDTN